MKNIITRGEFFKRIIRMLMISVLALIALSLGSRIVTGKDCSKCPGNGICGGEGDCRKYRLNEE